MQKRCHLLGRRSRSAWAKYADAFRRISFARPSLASQRRRTQKTGCSDVWRVTNRAPGQRQCMKCQSVLEHPTSVEFCLPLEERIFRKKAGGRESVDCEGRFSISGAGGRSLDHRRLSAARLVARCSRDYSASESWASGVRCSCICPNAASMRSWRCSRDRRRSTISDSWSVSTK